jgi:putative transposase
MSRLEYAFTRDKDATETPVVMLETPYKLDWNRLSSEWTQLKKDRPDYLEINAHTLSDVLRRVELAYKAFLKRSKEGVGYPKFKSFDFYNSFTSDNGFHVGSTDNPRRAKLYLQNIGAIKVQMHRPLPMPLTGVRTKADREEWGFSKKFEGISTCTIKKEIDQWFVCFACNVPAEKLPMSYEDVGIDVGIARFAAMSDGTFVENPRFYRKSEDRLAELQQDLSRKKKGSTRRKQAKTHVAKAHRKIRRQRHDFLHKTSHEVVDKYQLIAVEGLKITNMNTKPEPKQDETTGEYLPNGASAKSGLNKSIQDAGWGTFRDMLCNKGKGAGRNVVKVPAHHTSQRCSLCGHTSPDNRKTQACFVCVKCGFTENADTNASINILHRAKTLPSPNQKKTTEG